MAKVKQCNVSVVPLRALARSLSFCVHWVLPSVAPLDALAEEEEEEL